MHAVLQNPLCMHQHSTHHGASQAPPQAPEIEFEMLHAAYVEHAGALRDPCSESSRSRLANLSAQLQAKAVHGNNALQLIQNHSAQINWQGMSPEMFSSFYRFVYFICREPSKRNVQVNTAVAAWRLVLRGRFRLLDHWCTYVSAHHKANVVLEDTWRQLLDFSRTVHEDLSNYDPASAWPVLLDEFVEHLKGQKRGSRPPPVSVEALDMLAPWSSRGMTAMSPRSGSKRRPPDVMEVADQLQQLLSSEQAAAAGSPAVTPTAATAVRATGVAPGSNSNAIQRHLVAKRLRMGLMGPPPPLQQQQQQQLDQQGLSVQAGDAANGSDAAVHSRQLVSSSSVSAAACGAFDGHHIRSNLQDHSHHYQQQQQQQNELASMQVHFTPGVGPSSSHQGHHHSTASNSSRVIAAGGAAGPAYAGLPAGLALRECGLGFQQQQQQHQQQQQLSFSSGLMEMSAHMDGCSSQDMMEASSELHQHQQEQGFELEQQRRQQAQQESAVLCPAATHLLEHAGPVHSGMHADSMHRSSSMMAMMQVTVTEALGLH